MRSQKSGAANAPLTKKEKAPFKRSRWLLLKNPWNLSDDQKERKSDCRRWCSGTCRSSAPTTSKKAVSCSGLPATKRAGDYLEKWMRSAMRSRLEPFKKFVRMLRGHLHGILSWTKSGVSNGAVEGLNNKIKSISYRSFRFRPAANFIAAIYHCCARLPPPVERQLDLWDRNPT
jgi:transposase